MNNSKIWLVVNPTVGVPLFLGAVAVGSFAVHVSVLSNTTWVSDFLSGNELGAGSAAIATTDDTKLARAVEGAKLYFDQASDDEGLIILPDGRTARVTLEQPLELATVRRE